MKNKIVMSIFVNFGVALIFVLLNMWALEKSLEETFIFLAILYGIIVIIVNACLVALRSKK